MIFVHPSRVLLPGVPAILIRPSIERISSIGRAAKTRNSELIASSLDLAVTASRPLSTAKFLSSRRVGNARLAASASFKLESARAFSGWSFSSSASRRRERPLAPFSLGDAVCDAVVHACRPAVSAVSNIATISATISGFLRNAARSEKTFGPYFFTRCARSLRSANLSVSVKDLPSWPIPRRRTGSCTLCSIGSKRCGRSVALPLHL